MTIEQSVALMAQAIAVIAATFVCWACATFCRAVLVAVFKALSWLLGGSSNPDAASPTASSAQPATRPPRFVPGNPLIGQQPTQNQTQNP